MVSKFRYKETNSRLDPKKIISDAKKSPSPIYIFIGPHPIVLSIIEELIEVILPDEQRTTNLEVLRGEEITFSTIVGAFNSPSFFGGKRIFWIRISRLNKELLDWLKKGSFSSKDKILIFELENLDLDKKERETFKEISNKTVVIDFSLDTRHDIKQIIYSWVKEYGKNIEFKAINAFCEQVGNQDLVAIKNEIEKLISAIGDKPNITLEDIENIVVRHRQEALFELTQAIGEKNFSKCLTSFYWLVDQGIHPLAIISSLSIYVKRLCLIREAIEETILKKDIYRLNKIDFNRFKSSILPIIVGYYKEELPPILKNFKPYAQYRLFLAALNFSLKKLLFILVELSKLDIALKDSDPNVMTKFERLFAILTQQTDDVLEVE